MEDPSTWKTIFQTVGPWGTVAAAMGFFLWRLIVWVKPIGERVAASHIALVDDLRESLKVQGTADNEAHKTTHGKLDRANEKLDSIASRLERK